MEPTICDSDYGGLLEWLELSHWDRIVGDFNQTCLEFLRSKYSCCRRFVASWKYGQYMCSISIEWIKQEAWLYAPLARELRTMYDTPIPVTFGFPLIYTCSRTTESSSICEQRLIHIGRDLSGARKPPQGPNLHVASVSLAKLCDIGGRGVKLLG